MKGKVDFHKNLRKFCIQCGCPEDIFPAKPQVGKIKASFYIDKSFPARGAATEVTIEMTYLEKMRNEWDEVQMQATTGEPRSFLNISGVRRRERENLTRHLSKALKTTKEKGKKVLLILGSGCEPDQLQRELEECARISRQAMRRIRIREEKIRSEFNLKLQRALVELLLPPEDVEDKLITLLDRYRLDVFTENWTRKLWGGGNKGLCTIYALYHNDICLQKKGEKYDIEIEVARLEHRKFTEELCERTKEVDFVFVAGYSMFGDALGKSAYHGILIAAIHGKKKPHIIIFRRKDELYDAVQEWPKEIKERVRTISVSSPSTKTPQVISSCHRE